MMMKLHHIGYTTADITATSARFRSLGYEPGSVLKEDALQVELCYLQKAGEPTIELVRQHNPESLEANLLASEGVMPYHLCYEVADMETSLQSLEAEGYRRLFDPVPVSVLGGSRICYLHHSALGYLELLEIHP